MTIIVTGSWPPIDGSGEPPTGQVEFRPLVETLGTNQIAARLTVITSLTAGAIAQVLADDTAYPGLQYEVRESLLGADNPPPYVITPHANQDLSTASRGPIGPPNPMYVLQSQVGQDGGPAGPLVDGLIPPEQIPGSSGSGVQTVTAVDASIVIGGTSAAVTVGVGAVPQADVTGLTAALAAITSDVSTNATAITTETNRATGAEGVISTAVSTETTRAEGAESTIATNLADETFRAEAAEALLAPIASPALTGSPTAPTKTPLNASTDLATTAYADAAVAVETARAETAEGGKATSGALTAETARAEAAEALLAPLASPTFTGTPAAPTKTPSTNSTAVATTAYTDAAVAVELARAQGAETLLAPKASPAFTGTPTVPTAAPSTDNTQAASTAYADVAVGLEATRAIAAEALRQITAPAPQINRGRATVVTTYAAGHGWTAAGGWASSNVNDTADGRLSGQMLTGTTPGNTGTFPTFTKITATALSIAGQCLRVWIKLDLPTNAAAITLRVADTGGLAANRYISWTALASSGGTYRTNGVMIPANTWTELSFSLGSAFTSGTPNLAALTEYRWICQDNGTAFTVHFGGIEAYPALSGRFPNGVVAIGFDDCYAGQYSLAMNLLSSFGYEATLFPIVDQVGAGGSYTLAQLQQMVNIGWEVAPHAATLANHSGWNALTPAQAAADVAASKAWIASQGFGLSGVFAYPLGGFNGGLAAAIAPLCRVARTIDSTMMTESLPIGNELQMRSAAGVGGTGGIGVTTYTTATTGVLALARAAAAFVPITIHDVSAGASGNINQISIADLTTLVTAISASGMAVATYGEVLQYAMLGAVPAAPLAAGNSTITISGPQNAQTAVVTPGTYPSAAGGSATVAPTTAYAHRRDIAANWTSANLVLAAGELGEEADTGLGKFGDGATGWTLLPYAWQPYRKSTPLATQLQQVAWTMDPNMAPGSPGITTGRLYVCRSYIDQSAAMGFMTLDWLSASLTGSGATLTATNCYMGIYSTAGVQIAATADFSPSIVVSTTGGILKEALIGAPIAALPLNTEVWLTLLMNFVATGGTGSPVASVTVVGGRQYGTNQNMSSDPRLQTNSSGSTLSALPTNLPTLTQTAGFTMPYLGVQTS